MNRDVNPAADAAGVRHGSDTSVDFGPDLHPEAPAGESDADAGGAPASSAKRFGQVPRIGTVETLMIEEPFIPDELVIGTVDVPRQLWHRQLVAIDPGALGLEADGVALVRRQSRIEKGANHVLLIDGEIKVGAIEPLAKGGGWKAAIGGARSTTLVGDWSVVGLLVGVMGPDSDN